MERGLGTRSDDPTLDCNCHNRRARVRGTAGFVKSPSQGLQIAHSEDRGRRPFDLKYTYNAIENDASGQRVNATSGNDKFTLFAFMLSQSNYNAINPGGFASDLLCVVENSYNNDKSCLSWHQYRPVNHRGDFCVVGVISGTLSQWDFVSVEFDHTYPSGDERKDCCQSYYYDSSGNRFHVDYGFNGVLIEIGPPSKKYYLSLYSADCDRDYGLEFFFENIQQ